MEQPAVKHNQQKQPNDDALIESLKSLIISRKQPMTVQQLQEDYEKVEGRKIPELKLQSLLKYNKIFHYIKPADNNSVPRFDVRYDARKPPQKSPQVRFNPIVITRSLKNPAVPRNRLNNNGNYQKNLNGNILTTPIIKPLPKLTMPLSERLKRKGELSPQDIQAARGVVNIPIDTWYFAQGSDYEKLTKYCQTKSIDMPELKFINNPLAKGSFACQVTINGKTYMSFNDFFPTKGEAQEACCKVAVYELKREEELSRNPLDASNDYDIAQKIWIMIRNSIGGVFFKHISNMYMETYKLSLPDNWNQIVKQFDGQLFNFEMNAFNEEIIFATGDGTVDRPPTPIEQSIPVLEFPWKDKLWNVYVTGASSPTDISARLIGPDYSDALDKLLNEIEITMISTKERPSEIKLSYVYLTSIAECWHRIKIIEMNEEEVYCICIDNGEYEWISRDDIYVCKPEFLTVAPQSFKLSLFDLEEFENNPNVAQQALYEPFVYKSLVAEVMMNQEFWTMNKSKPICVILYDTSTEDDINLNERLMNAILSSVSTPTLSQKESNQIIVTHIGDDGIYGQLVKSSAYIQQLINNVPKEDLTAHRGLYEDRNTAMGRKKIYMVYEAKKKNWFRARYDKSIDATVHVMFMVDHGYFGKFNTQDIYRLDKLSYVLSLYPPQCIKMLLYNVAYTEDVKKRLLGMLPGRQAFAKIVTMSSGQVPYVTLFMYIQHNNESIIFNINDQFSKLLSIADTASANEPLVKLDRRQLKNNGEFIKLYVSLVSSPLSFVIQLEEDLKQLNEIMGDLQKHCAASGKFSSLNDLQKGECYAVYDDDTRKWVRASVENILDKNFIHCLCVDSGNFKTMSLDKMRSLPNKFRTLPKLALKARLSGVKPKYKDFTPDDAIHFKKLTENKSFPAVIKNISSDPFEKQDIYDVVLFGKDDKIHEILIKEGRALPI